MPRLSPGTPLAGMTGGLQPDLWLARVQRGCSVPLSWPLASPWVEPVGPALAGMLAWWGSGSLAIGALLVCVWLLVSRHAGPAPRYPLTAGDLLRRNMHAVWREFAGGRRGTRSDVLLALIAICRDASSYEGPVDRTTTFLARS